MNIIDQVYAVLIYAWSELHSKAPLMGFLIAVTVATLRSLTERNFRLAEVLLCGVLAAIGCTSGELLSVLVATTSGLVVNPDVMGGFVAGVVGYAGSKETMLFIKKRFIKDTKEVDDDPNKG